MSPAQEMTSSNIGQSYTNENGEGILVAYRLLNLRRMHQSFGYLQDKISNVGHFSFAKLHSYRLATN